MSSTPASPLGWLVVAAGLAGLVGLAGCSGVEPVAPYDKPVTDPTQIFTRLTLDYRVLTLSTDPTCHCATWQLTATPRDALGETMTSLPAPTFGPLSPGDTLTAQVTADGRVTALQTGTTQILVELSVGNVRHADTAFIEVNNPVSLPTLASVSLEPLPPDSAIRPQLYVPFPAPNGILGGSFRAVFFGTGYFPVFSLQPRVLGTLGESVTGLAFDFESLDPTIATMTPAPDRRTTTWTPVSPGQARFVVRTTAYGVTVVDTAVFTVTRPIYAVVLAQPKPGEPSASVFYPSEVHVRPNGLVFWYNLVDHPIEATFDDPANVIEAPAGVCTFLDNFAFAYGPAPNCTTGNVTLAPPPATSPDTSAFHPSSLTLEVRRFPVAGVYPYRDASTGATGRVVVE